MGIRTTIGSAAIAALVSGAIAPGCARPASRGSFCAAPEGGDSVFLSGVAIRKLALGMLQSAGQPARDDVAEARLRKATDAFQASTSARLIALAAAPDFVSVTKGNALALSEAKGIESSTGKVDVTKALKQLKNAMKKVTEKGLAGDVERVELIMPKGAKLNDDDLAVLNGYLVRVSEGNKRITVEGFKNLIMVIEL